MTYKVISTLVSSGDPVATSVEAAISLSGRYDAHLDIHAIGFDSTDPGFYYAGATAVVTQSNLQNARETQEAAEAWVTARLDRESIRWSMTGTVLQNAALHRYLSLRLRFCDLVVLPRPYQDATSNEAEQIAEACLFEAERPVLMMPDGSELPREDGRIVMGWNDGAEALAAARAALPFLQAASQVDICVIDPPRHGEGRSDPGGLLAQYLMRHGVKSEVAVMARTEESIGNILMRKAQETGAEMIVTGAYGHSRLREAVFGGTSRDLLSNAQLPLFMGR